MTERNTTKVKAEDNAAIAKGIKLGFDLPRDDKKQVVDADLMVRRTAAGYRPGSATRKFAKISLVDLDARPAYYAKKFPKLSKKMKISARQKAALDTLTLTQIEQAYANG